MSLVGAVRWNRLLVILLATAAFVPGAEAATLSGTVTDDLGAPLAQIEVSAYVGGAAGWQLATFGETGPDGAYQLDGLADGTYRVLFRDWSQTYAFQYHPGVGSIDDAWDVTVTAGGAVVDAALPPGGRISGVITDGVGAPLEYPIVFVSSSGNEPEVLFVGQVDEPSGIYEVGGLPTGDYHMMFSGRRGAASWTEYFDDAIRLSDATPIAVTAGATTSGIDAQLGPPAGGYPGGLEGIVRATDGTPLPDIEVSLYANVDPGEWTLVSFQSTDADGWFEFLDLPADTYTLGFRDWNQAYAFTYWGGVDRLDAALPIEVDGDVLPADVTLDLGGRMTGRLTDPAGDPLDNAMVFVHTTDDPPQVLFLTNPDSATGDYRLGGLPTGEYVVQFSGWQGLDSYVGYYDGAASLDLAQPVPVTLGEVTAGIDGELGIPPGGVISGRITDPYGRSFDFARVRAFRDDGGSWVLAGEADTAFYESEYELPLPPGTYRLRFEAGSFLQPDLPAVEVFDDVLTLDEGTDVEVVLDQRIEGFDVTVGNRATGSLAGTVTDADTGAPVSGIEVWVADRKGRVLYDQIATTDAAGAYRVDGLWPERYTVELYDPSYTYQTKVVGQVLVGEEPVEGVNGSLNLAPPGTLPGAIAGTVRDDGGQPLFGVRVSASTLDGSGFGAALTDSAGRYRVRDLPSCQYEVRFDSRDGFQVTEYFDDVTDPDAATPVPVAMATTTSSIDADLAPAGIVTGSITNRFGNPFQIATAIVYEDDGGDWRQVATASVVSDSEYRIPGVPVGTYRVQLIGQSLFGGTGLAEYFDDALTIELGTDVEVVAGEITAGISGSLGQGPPGAIAGTVTDGAGTPLDGIRVQIYDEGFELEAETVTGPDGGYEVPDLYRGRYSVAFSDPQGVYPGEVYNNVSSLDLATPVVVDDTKVMGIDAALDGAGSGPGGGGIRGIVTDVATGAGIEGIRVSCVDELFGFPVDCSTHTAADGSYQLGGFLTSGSYLVRFSAPNGGWVEEWYDDVRPPLEPTPVSVTEGAWTDDVDAALEPAGAISGTVTNEGGGEFSRLTVTAFRLDGAGWQPFDSTTVIYDTEYELRGLPEGTYRIKFRGGSIFNPSYGVEEFFDDVVSIDLATDVEVAVGVVTPGIDAVLGNLGGGGDLMNPSFDTGLEGWVIEVSSGASAHHGSPDAGGSASSGSLEITADGSAPATAMVSQCLSVDADSVVDFGAWSQATGAAATSSAIWVTLEIYDDIDCNGALLADATSPTRTGVHDWSPVSGSALVPTGARAGRLSLTVQAANPGELAVNWDEAFVERATDALFADGLESGSTGAWSGATP